MRLYLAHTIGNKIEQQTHFPTKLGVRGNSKENQQTSKSFVFEDKLVKFYKNSPLAYTNGKVQYIKNTIYLVFYIR